MKTERINGFDALRTIAMWLGIVLHSIIIYKSVPEANWPHDDKMASGFLEWLYQFIHVFRMPLFFLVGGFFSRLVILRSGFKYFLKQRFKRIVLPFVVGVILIVPLSLLPFNFYKFYFQQHFSLQESLKSCFYSMLKWNGLAHLWFLYYLIIFYLITGCFVWIFKKVSLINKWNISHSLQKIGLLKLFSVSLILFGVLFFFKAIEPPVYTGIRVNKFYLIYYGFFFTAGWILQINMKSVESFAKHWLFLLLVSIIISVVLFIKPVWLSAWLLFLLGAVETISLIGGVTGFFMKYCNAESKIWRYCSDAAYWVYLVHLIIVSALQVSLINSPVPVGLRLPIVLLTTTIISLLSYHLFVRYTIIGEYLHGKRKRSQKVQPKYSSIKTLVTENIN